MTRNLPPLDSLISFEAVARQLSFSKAEEEVHITPSAISRQVKKLEKSLGFSLFERLHRDLKLTEQGEVLHEAVQHLLETLTKTVADLKQEEDQRQVRVSASNPFAALWLVPKLADFKNAHPDIDLHIDSNNRVVDLKQDLYDVAIRYTTLEETKEEDHLYLSEENIFPVCSPSFLQKLGMQTLSVNKLASQTLLHLNDPRNSWPWLQWGHWFQSMKCSYPRAKGYRFSHVDQLIQAAVTGQGIALGSSPLVDSLLEQGILVTPVKKSLRSPRSFIACFGPNKDDATMVFIDWIQATMHASRAKHLA